MGLLLEGSIATLVPSDMAVIQGYPQASAGTGVHTSRVWAPRFPRPNGLVSRGWGPQNRTDPMGYHWLIPLGAAAANLLIAVSVLVRRHRDRTAWISRG
jgi:hypothetical protein